MEKVIRFVDTNYADLFQLPSGQRIYITMGMEVGSFVCTYVDDTHFSIGGRVYHIHEFAELCEREGYRVSMKKDVIEADSEQESKKFFYNDGAHGRVYITDAQAEEIYRQKERRYKALDLKYIIDDKYFENVGLRTLTVDDLEVYVEQLEFQQKMYENDLDWYWKCCQTVVEDIIMPKLEGSHGTC